MVGVDGSRENAPAVDYASRWAAGLGVRLELLAVVQGAGTLPPYVAAPDDPEESLLGELARSVRNAYPSLEVSANVAFGNAVECLTAASVDAVGTVVGSRGLGGFGRALLGSVSSALTGHAPRPVVVVPARWTAEAHPDNDPVVVGLAADQAGDHAVLHWAFAEATRTRSPLEVVHAVDTSPVLAWDREGLGIRQEPPAPGPDSRIRDAVAAEQEHRPDLEVRVVEEAGHPADVLLYRGAQARLLVVGRRHRGLGSVRRAVLHHANVPVAVVPQDASAP